MKKTNSEHKLSFAIEAARATDEFISKFDEFSRACARICRQAKNETDTDNITANSLVDFYYLSRPDIAFEIGRELVSKIRRLSDAQGICLFESPNSSARHYAILGHKVLIIDEPAIRIRYTFPCGSSHVVKFTG